MWRFLFVLILLQSHCFCYAWNAVGHQLIAQIAYDNLTPEAKRFCHRYLRVQQQYWHTPEAQFIAASTWLDDIRKQRVSSYNALHYIDIPFSRDRRVSAEVNRYNALTAMNHAVRVLSSSNASTAEKTFNLRLLIHVIGDIHQPLHTCTKVSRKYPKGDRGGNLFILAKNPVGRNLHQYWDNGAGLFKAKKININYMAHQLEKRWSCSVANQNNEFAAWINNAHDLAVTHAYSLRARQRPRQDYQYKAQYIIQQQIVFAGCRLAHVLNQIASET